jgi:predicted PurR-regulated permease PerM
MASADPELARQTPDGPVGEETDVFYRHVLVLALVALLGLLLFVIVRPFVSSLVWALLLAFLLSPANRHVRRLLKGSKGWAALALTLAVLFCLAIPTALLAGRFVVQGIDLVERLSAAQERGDWTDLAWIQRLGQWLEGHLPVEASQVYGWVTNRLSSVFSSAITVLLGLAGGIVNGIASLIVTLTILFFVLRDGDGVGRRLMRFVPMRQADKDALMAQTAAVTRASVLGSMATAAVQGTLVGLAFLITGLPSPVVFGVIASFFSLLPVVGTAAVWLPGAIALAFQHHWVAAVFLAAWGLFVVGIADNVVRPLFVSGRAEVPTLAVLLGVLGGISAFGFVGTFLGPVILSVVLALLRLAAEAGDRRASAPQGEEPK